MNDWPWYAVLLALFGAGMWSALCILVGAAIMKSSYSPPSDPRSLNVHEGPK